MKSPLTQSEVLHDNKRNHDEPNFDSSGSKNNRKRKKKHQSKEEIEIEDEEERKLTSMIFGTFGSSQTVEAESAGLFNTGSKQPNELDKSIEANKVLNSEENEEPLFMIDREAHQTTVDAADTNDEPKEVLREQQNGHHDKKENVLNERTATKPAWQDDDDEVGVENYGSNEKNVSLLSNQRNKSLRQSQSESDITISDYVQRQRAHFQNTATARTDWATVGKHNIQGNKQDYDMNITTAQSLLSSTEPLLAARKISSLSSRLPPSQISIVRCKDVNWKEKVGDSVLRSVQFHPTQGNDGHELLFTAGLDKKIKFFKVDASGERSEKVHGIYFPDLPIHKASFLGSSGDVVASGRRPYFYLYNAEVGKMDKIPRILGRPERSLESFITSPNGKWIVFLGNDGNLIIWEVRSKRLVGTLKINGQVRCASFSEDSNELLASGSDGDIYRFDMRTRRCLSRFQNEDGTVSSSLSLSSQLMAVGAESGVVNLYSTKNSSPSSTTISSTPLKSILNIQTLISKLSFNPTGEMLAISSKMDKNAFRLLHLPTQSIFANWPTSKTPLGYVWDMDFSPTSKFMAIGNDKGKCLLYKLNHYE